MFFFPNLPADGGNDDARYRREEVEEAVGQIGERGHAEDGALGETAGVPGNEHGGDRRAVLTRAAQQARLVAPLQVGVAEHGAGEHDGEILVGHSNIAEQCGADGGGHK